MRFKSSKNSNHFSDLVRKRLPNLTTISTIYYYKSQNFKLSFGFNALKINDMASKTASHILGSSLHLLSICLVIMTSIHLTKTAQQHFIDELTCFLAFVLTATSILSFNSIRKDNLRYERYAEYLFIAAVIGILGIVTYIAIFFWWTGSIPLK